ncbi:MAG TPA: alpha/beta family hydrolase [Sphingomicrobium sp.]
MPADSTGEGERLVGELLFLMDAQNIVIPVGAESVSGLLLHPANAKALYLFAHGAAVGMTHKAMESNAQGLAARAIATLRYQFPYMDKGSRRPDPPPIAHSAVRAAAAEALELAPDLPLFAGGRSFGGRMTSQAQSKAPLSGVRGLAFLGFPLHRAGKPGVERADHLAGVKTPMLFVSGSRDALAELALLKPIVDGLGECAELHVVEGADHGFNVPAKSGRTSADTEAEALDAMTDWMLRLST